MTEPSMSMEAWVRETCSRQGVPVRVTDRGVLRRVAILIGEVWQTPTAKPGCTASGRGERADACVKSPALGHVKRGGAADGSGSPERSV